MNSLSFYNRVKYIIEETWHAYDLCNLAGQINMDYADFVATNCFRQFGPMLQGKDLTRRQLKHIVRRANLDYLRAAERQNCWASFMAGYMTQQINDNAFVIPIVPANDLAQAQNA